MRRGKTTQRSGAMNLATPWTPVLLLALLAALIQLVKGRLAGWRIAALAGAGLAAVLASLVLLRLSPETAPLGFPWEPALGTSPHWAADPAMFPFALVLLLLLVGVVLSGASAARWPSAFLLVAVSMGFLLAEDLLALALAWMLMEALLRFAGRDSVPRRDISAFDALWGFLGLAGILFLWHATDGASLRAYETSQWTGQARIILMGVVVLRMGAYPFVSRRLAVGADGFSPVDASAAAPIIAGLALAEHAALLGPLPVSGWLMWIGAGSALICGFAAWQSASARAGLDWAIRAVLGLVLMLWGADIVPPSLLFPCAAASIGLGIGLWVLRPCVAQLTGPVWRRGVRAAAWFAPAVILGMGPLSPAALPMLKLWQHLLDQSVFLPLILGLAGQTIAMSALLRADAFEERPLLAATPRRMVYIFWLLCALAWALLPHQSLALGSDESGALAAALEIPQSLGAWAALALPLLCVLGLPGRSRLSPAAQVWMQRVSGILSLGWLRSAALAAGQWIGGAIEGLDDLLSGDGALPWALAFLFGLALFLMAK